MRSQVLYRAGSKHEHEIKYCTGALNAQTTCHFICTVLANAKLLKLTHHAQTHIRFCVEI